MTVGSHLAHLSDGSLHKAFTCVECHIVPTFEMHANGRVDLVWGSLSKSGSATPTWTTATGGCTNYCHGATLTGGSHTTPIWNKVDGTQASCGSCHALPPAAPHPTSTACGSCHAGYTATTVNVATHVNGQVETNGQTCTSCHGTAARVLVSAADVHTPSAPPVDTHGNTATSARGVGAHLAHLNIGTFTNPLACTECHPVPISPSHSNGVVDIAFGVLAKTGGASPTWNGTSCSNSYCHGNFAGGAHAQPQWTSGTINCASCHAAAPSGGTHAKNTHNHSCGKCHGGYSASSVDKNSHINGVVEGAVCTDCH
jgi:predicted CxxxxCH...CXXCH cytochrome family protein